MSANVLRSTFALAISIAATIATVAGSAAPARAAETHRTAQIDTSRLDLTNPAGRAALHAEITRTATRICNTGNTRDLIAAQAMRQCVAAALATAEPQVEMLAAAQAARHALADTGVAVPSDTVRR